MLVCAFPKLSYHWNASNGEIGQARWFWLLEVASFVHGVTGPRKYKGRKYKENGKAASDVLEDLEHGQAEVSQSVVIIENTCRICWRW